METGYIKMRVDNGGIVDILKSNIEIGIKGSKVVGTDQTQSKEVAVHTGASYSVTATNVEKALFSLESELEKIKQEAGNLNVDAIKKHMSVLCNTLTTVDAEELQGQGYSLNDTDVEAIVTVMDKIKAELAKGGMDISIFGDDLSMEQMEKITGSAGQAMQMAASLKDCQDGDITYLVGNELEPTIENLYRAQHSGTSQGNSKVAEVPQDTNLQKQIAQIITEAGLRVNDTTMGYGALLLANQIPLTPENIAYTAQLKQLKLPLDQKEIQSAISQAVSEGKAPQQAYLAEGYSNKDRAIAAQEIIDKASDGDIKTVLEMGKPLTIEALGNAQKQAEAGQEQQNKGQQTWENQKSEAVINDEDLRLITARRQLEEIRLVMTSQANYQLLKQGISIETLELEQLVEELKNTENNYYKNLLQGNGIAATSENVDLFRETTEKADALKLFPAYTLGRHSIATGTLDSFYESGNQIKASLEQANQSYETMMTRPRKDLGDDIQKAFRNVDDILTDLDLETSPANQRAVRILAYNQIEINEENIRQMKTADEKMQNLLENLKPQVVMEMIRQGVHPLETDIVTLSAKAEEIVQQLDPGKEEKYSEYLWKLEQNHEITPEERESYVGIFRLLRQIEKTDGAVIGAIVNQGGELSLKNLLSAVRTRRTNGINVNVDDALGERERIQPAEDSISQQIDVAYQTECAKAVLQKLTPEHMQSCMENTNWQDMTPEQLLWQFREQQMAEEQKSETNHTQYQQQLDLFGANQTAEDAVLQILQHYEMPMDTYHILAASRMINNRNGIFNRLFDPETMKKQPDLQGAKEILFQRFAEAVKTPEDMAEAQKALADTAEHVMENMINEPDISSLDVRDLKVLRTQIELSGKMSREENYAIPVMIADEMTNVQLKIVRGKEKRGIVDILFQTEKLGKVAASIRVLSNKTEGFVVSDREETLELLKEKSQKLTEQLSNGQERSVRFNFMKEENLSLTEFSQTARTQEASDKDSEDYQVQTKQLYHIAKEFLEMVREV